MLPGLFAAPAHVWIRRRRLALVAVALAAAALAAGLFGRRGAEPPALTTVAHVCTYPAEPTPPPPPPEPEPSAETWDLLERCLGAHPEGPPHRAAITVAEIRGWIALPRAVWFYEGAWWFPLSDEGTEEMPSGLYLSVPVDGSACGGAIIN